SPGVARLPATMEQDHRWIGWIAANVCTQGQALIAGIVLRMQCHSGRPLSGCTSQWCSQLSNKKDSHLTLSNKGRAVKHRHLVRVVVGSLRSHLTHACCWLV